MGEQLHDLIRQAEGADAHAADALFAALYDELHRLAEHSLRRSAGIVTVSPTTLLHEAYLRMAARGGLDFPDRAHFLSYAARAMRGLLIDLVRERGAQKRGRDLEVTLTEAHSPTPESEAWAADLAELGEALEELGKLDPSLAQLVDLHFFCGFTFAEIAGLRAVSERTVQRDWRKARLLLHRALLEDS